MISEENLKKIANKRNEKRFFFILNIVIFIMVFYISYELNLKYDVNKNSLFNDKLIDVTSIFFLEYLRFK